MCICKYKNWLTVNWLVVVPLQMSRFDLLFLQWLISFTLSGWVAANNCKNSNYLQQTALVTGRSLSEWALTGSAQSFFILVNHRWLKYLNTFFRHKKEAKMCYEVEILRGELKGLLKCLENIQNCASDAFILEQLRLKNQQLEQEILSIRKESEFSENIANKLSIDKATLRCELESLKSENFGLLQSLECVKTEKETLLENSQKLVSENEGKNSVNSNA